MCHKHVPYDIFHKKFKLWPCWNAIYTFNIAIDDVLLFSSDFSKFDYLKFLWDHIDHDEMNFKATIFDGGYLGKHSNPNMTYSAQVLAGVEPNTSITKWIFEYDETFGDESGVFNIRDMHDM